jgi:hypothetical protein
MNAKLASIIITPKVTIPKAMAIPAWTAIATPSTHGRVDLGQTRAL